MNYVLAVVREIIHIVQRTHAIRYIVHRHSIVLQIHNHTNRLCQGIVFYIHDLTSTRLTAQYLVRYLNIRRRLRNVSKRMSE